jgi:hypothetical protein
MAAIELFWAGVVSKHPYSYLVSIIGLTLIIRFILCLFKALAITNGEIDEVWEREEDKISKKYVYWEIVWKSFSSYKSGIKIDDYWLPAIIGIFELAVFPVLMIKEWWGFIGAWIGIKTASSWGGWKKARTAYNRFLLGNLLSLLASYFLVLLFRFWKIKL